MLIVNDGEIIKGALDGLGRDGAWLDSVLEGEGVALSEVLLMTSDGSSSTVIRKKRFRSGGEASP